MICFAVTTNGTEGLLDILNTMVIYHIMFKVKSYQKGGYLFIVPHKINKPSDYRLCEMCFQMNYRQVPQSGGNLHFHGRI